MSVWVRPLAAKSLLSWSRSKPAPGRLCFTMARVPTLPSSRPSSTW
uniref:Uncharacterized protein n=1 Tax=Arundo donax TaxID=35708 RepID=A0A0A9HNT1_ARUDO